MRELAQSPQEDLAQEPGQAAQELGQPTQKVLVIKIFKNLCGNCWARIIIIL
jgi:hypothetical protein